MNVDTTHHSLQVEPWNEAEHGVRVSDGEDDTRLLLRTPDEVRRVATAMLAVACRMAEPANGLDPTTPDHGPLRVDGWIVPPSDG